MQRQASNDIRSLAAASARFQLEPVESRVMLSSDPQGLIIQAVVAVLPVGQSTSGVFMSFRADTGVAPGSFAPLKHVDQATDGFRVFSHREAETPIDGGVERMSGGAFSAPTGETAGGFVRANYIQVIAPIAPGLWEVV